MKKRKIKSSWVDYFNFSARERRGTALLVFIILFEIIFLHFLNNYHSPVDPPDPGLVKAVLALNESTQLNESYVKNPDTILLHAFDPNKITASMASSIGLSEKQSSVILNYISKGGVFRIKSDFKKMYCISEKQYELLESYIQLPDSLSKVKRSKPEHKYGIVDINKADTAELMQVKGIGHVFASRIVKYRELLGGFISKEQLKEVYGMNDSLYDILLLNFVLSEEIPFRFIHLNSDTITLLAAHPYIRWKLAYVIVNYRKQHAFRSVDELKTLPIINDECYTKLYRYLKID